MNTPPDAREHSSYPQVEGDAGTFTHNLEVTPLTADEFYLPASSQVQAGQEPVADQSSADDGDR